MKFLMFLLIYGSSFFPGATAETKPAMYITVTWNIPWSTFCYIKALFTEKLSDELLELKGNLVYRVQSDRIRYLNLKSQCVYKKNEQDAVVELYVSKTANLSTAELDKDMTFRAYNILYDYWKNKKMTLMDKVFQGKVDEVKLQGAENLAISTGLTEEGRVGIGIAVGLAIAFLIVAVYFIVALKRKIKRPSHGVDVSFRQAQYPVTRTSNATQDYDGESGRWNKSETGSAVYNMGLEEPLELTML